MTFSVDLAGRKFGRFELLEKLGATLGAEAKPQEKSFVDSLKDLFGGTAG